VSVGGVKGRLRAHRTPAADDTNSQFDDILPELDALDGRLWIRRVLVRSQEGQLKARCEITSRRASCLWRVRSL
jgi:hypothetical protein